MKRTFENCSIRKRATGPLGAFNDTSLNNKGQCKGFKLPYPRNVLKYCEKCELWEGKDE